MASVRPGAPSKAAAFAARSLAELTQRARPGWPRRLDARELRTEIASALLFVLTAAALAVALPTGRTGTAWLALALALLHGAFSRVRLQVGAGYAVPTELTLVPMLFLLPAGWVPACVATGLLLTAAVNIVRGAEPSERAVLALGDSWHAVGPALVIYAAGEPAAGAAALPVLAVALLTQLAADVLSSLAREWVGRGIPPGLQLRATLWAWTIDVLLAPIGLLAAAASTHGRPLWLLVVPLAFLLAAFARDRRRRIDEALARVGELHDERRRMRAVLERVGEAFAANLDREALLGAVLDTAREALGAEAATARPAACETMDPAARRAVAAAAGGALRVRAPSMVAVGDWHALAGPLRSTGALAPRVLTIARRHTPFTGDEREIFAQLCVQAGIALENVELHDRLRRQAATDGLTGLANHRRFQERLAEHVDRAGPNGPWLGLLLIDIDDFKAVNDIHGHQAGDLVLREVAKVLLESVRSTDTPARYGGEELAVVLPRTRAADAAEVAEQIRQKIEDHVVVVPSGRAIGVTVSIGVAAIPGSASEPTALIAAADRALYAAKRAGKNRVVLARARPAVSALAAEPAAARG